MVKKKIFLRMAKSLKTGKYRVVADSEYNKDLMWSSTDPYTRQYLPTAHFAVEVDIPDKKFMIESATVKKLNLVLNNTRLIEKL